MGNIFDTLWLLMVLGIAIGGTIPALRTYGLVGLVALPILLVVLGIAAIVARRLC